MKEEESPIIKMDIPLNGNESIRGVYLYNFIYENAEEVEGLYESDYDYEKDNEDPVNILEFYEEHGYISADFNLIGFCTLQIKKYDNIIFQCCPIFKIISSGKVFFTFPHVKGDSVWKFRLKTAVFPDDRASKELQDEFRKAWEKFNEEDTVKVYF